MKHIEFSRLVDKFEGRIANGDKAEIEAHIAQCQYCRAEDAKLSALYSYSPPMAAEQVPQAATARILNIYQRPFAGAKPPESKRVGLMSLIFDDWTMALSERFSGLESRQLLYRAGDYEIDLRINLEDEECRLAGQIFPEIAGASAELRSATRSVKVEVSEFGEFIFETVPQGVYELHIAAAELALCIEQVPLHY